jgi:hypothetical protein
MPKTIARMMLTPDPEAPGLFLGYLAPNLGALNRGEAVFAGFVVDTSAGGEAATHALAAARVLATTVAGARAFQIRGAEHGIPRIYSARGEFVALGAAPFKVPTVPGGRGPGSASADLGAFATGSRAYD